MTKAEALTGFRSLLFLCEPGFIRLTRSANSSADFKVCCAVSENLQTCIEAAALPVLDPEMVFR